VVRADLVGGARLLNAASSWRCQSGEPGVRPFFDAGILGQGQVIAVLDTGIDADHCAFFDAEHGLPPANDDAATTTDPLQRKVIAVDFLWSGDWPDPGPWDWDDHGHGTHVAGSAAGDAGEPGVYDGSDGMAPLARLVIQDGGAAVDACADLPGLGCPVRPLEPVYGQSYAQGARIFSNSWGDAEEAIPGNVYTERTADVDRFVWTHRDAVMLFAAGNSGPEQGTVLSPSTGKNVISVGAAVHGDEEPPCPAWFSSRGPTDDGRIKPDIVAPGQGVWSAASDGVVSSGNCGLVPMSGTSMATPTAAGLAALVRQYLEEGRAPDGVPRPERGLEPSAALVKAVLVAAAVDMRELGCAEVEPVPSPDQGWGLVQLDRALPLPGSGFRLLPLEIDPGLESVGESVSTTVELEAPGPLQAVLVWTDPPSTPDAVRHLVNDLDLVVRGPDGEYAGNVFADGASVPGGDPDRLNTVEVVRLPEAAAGRWTVEVRAAALGHGPQPFALVITGRVRAAGARQPAGRGAAGFSR